MFTKIYWIHQFQNSARLGIMPRPRGEDWLAEEMNNLKKQSVGALVSLLEKDEISELGLKDEENICIDHGIEYINFPIPDRGVPSKDGDVHKLIELLRAKLNAGISVVVHCRMGIGRSSIVAAAILMENTRKANDLIDMIGKIRGLKVPDTEEQLIWLRDRES